MLTPPVPQSLALLAAGQVVLAAHYLTALSAVRYEPCRAVLAVLDGPTGLPEPGTWDPQNGPIDWVADNERKGISASPAVTFTPRPSSVANTAHRATSSLLPHCWRPQGYPLHRLRRVRRRQGGGRCALRPQRRHHPRPEVGIEVGGHSSSFPASNPVCALWECSTWTGKHRNNKGPGLRYRRSPAPLHSSG